MRQETQCRRGFRPAFTRVTRGWVPVITSLTIDARGRWKRRQPRKRRWRQYDGGTTNGRREDDPAVTPPIGVRQVRCSGRQGLDKSNDSEHLHSHGMWRRSLGLKYLDGLRFAPNAAGYGAADRYSDDALHCGLNLEICACKTGRSFRTVRQRISKSTWSYP